MTELPEPPGLSPLQQSDPKANILLVDNNPANLLSLRAILDDLGQNLVEACSSAEALQRVGSKEFAVVLLDVLVPEIGGFETAKRIRDGNRSRHTPIIFLSAKDIDRTQLEEAYSLGAVDFLVKPLLPVVLRAKVRCFVELYQDKQRERLHVTLASLGDAVISTDAEGRVDFLNPVAQERVGWKNEEATRRPLEDVFHILNEDTRLPVENRALRALRDGKIVGLANHSILVARDGEEHPLDDRAAPIRDAEGRVVGSVLVVRDLGEQKKIERHRIARLAVTDALNQSDTVEDAAKGVLRAICESLGWDAGFFWLVDKQGNNLTCRQRWHRPEVPLEEFEAVSCSLTFEKGRGLPGRVWASGKSDWILDIKRDANFPRLVAAVNNGLHSAFACPINVSDQTLGVIEFFTQRIREMDADLLEMMGSVAGNVGQFIERKSAESELRRSEQELADFFESAAIGLHWVGADGTIVRANQAELDMLGYSRQEYVSHRISDFHVDEDVICDILKRLRAGEKLAEYPARLRCKDGSIKDVLIDSSVLWKEGKFVHTRCLTRDVTERNRAEKALRESEQRFTRFMQHLPGLAWIKDVAGRYVYANDAAEKAFRTTRAELYGKSDEEVFAPETAAIFRSNDQQALSSGTGLQVVESLEQEDGTVRYSLVSKFPILGPDGQVALVGGIAIDITEQRRVEQALNESVRLYRAIGESIDYGVWVCDPQGRNIYASESFLKLVGLTQEQCAAFGWGNVLHPDDAERNIAAWKECVRTGGEWDIEHRFRSVDGQWRSVLARGVPVKNDRGEITAWAGINLDISRLKQVEDKLRDTDRRKDEFLATLAHELRNPLAPIRNSLQILKMPRIDMATVQQARDMMERQVHHLVRLVDDLLDVSRVMRGKIELRRERVELATIVARAVETAKPLIEVQGHQLDVSIPQESLLLDADAVRLAQVVGNLLTNSAKYSEANGHIWLVARREGDEAVLSIRDMGIGIAPDMLPHIFELFVQADHASTKAQGGLGIGLTLVKNLVEMHNGTVQAQSAGVGKGSEFTVRLPLFSQLQAPSKTELLELDQAIPTSGNRVMVVDDNRDAAISFSMLLRLQGHEVRVAHDGLAALEIAVAFRPDLIFLDIGMPGMDGYEVARQVRHTPVLEKTILAALTGWGQQEDRRRTAEAGFNHHLVKPPEPKAIESVLASLPKRQ